MVAVSHSALMFHPKVRGFYEFITVLIKRVRAEPMFKGSQHGFYICAELCFGFFKVAAYYPIIEVELAFFAIVSIGKFGIVTDVGRYIIIIDGVGHKPIEPGIAIIQISYFTQAAIRYIF